MTSDKDKDKKNKSVLSEINSDSLPDGKTGQSGNGEGNAALSEINEDQEK